MIAPPLKWHGGKHYLARRIVGLMPAHLHYVEPFAGGLSVLLAKDPDGVSEVVNDLDGRLMNFWRTLQDSATFERFQRIIEATPFAESEWETAHRAVPSGDAVEDAVRFFIDCRQSLAGRGDCFAPLSRIRVRRRMNEQASAWLSAVDRLPEVHARLRRVVILNRPALEVIRSQDGPATLFYVDPPYLPSVRTSPDVYPFEMPEQDHVELLELLATVRGNVLLSGYPSPLYDRHLAGWHKHAFHLPNHAAGGAAKRRMTELVWTNFHWGGLQPRRQLKNRRARLASAERSRAGSIADPS